MADYYHINGNEINEVMISHKSFFEKSQNGESFTLDINSKYGLFFTETVQLKNMNISNFKMSFNRNIILTDEIYPSIGLEINRRGYSHHNLNINKSKIYKFKSQHCALHFSNGNAIGQSIYDKNIEAEYLYFQFTPRFLKILSQLYPCDLENCLKRYEKDENFILNDMMLPITFQMQQILSQIENANLLGNSSSMFTEAKVIELLALQFDFINHKKSLRREQKSINSISDKEKIHEARSVLLSDLSDTPSLRELSLQVGINEKKLKQGFKEVFGTTVYGYLYQHKMHLAKQYLLDSSLLINEIAFCCGYEYVSHFSTAFKRFYGCTPLEIREGLSHKNSTK